MRIVPIALAVSLALGGCANLNTIGRSTALPNGGTAVHLDAPQRLAIVNSKGWACAEPSPDALQAYASSLGAGFGKSAQESISIAQALSTSAGSIGLRTPSITLMRDAFYRICELYSSGALTEQQTAHLFQRSQDLTLAILAIEQLTGTVVAQQVTLNSNSAANAAATINDTQKELDRAREDEKVKKEAKETADKELEAQKKMAADKKAEATSTAATAKPIQDLIDKVNKDKADHEAALSKAQGDKANADGKVAALKEQEKSLTSQRAKQQKEVDRLHEEVDKAAAALDKAKKAQPPDPVEIDKLTGEHQSAVDNENAAKAVLKTYSDTLATTTTNLAKEQKASLAADRTIATEQQKIAEARATLQSLKANPVQVAADNASKASNEAIDGQNKKQATADAAAKALEEAEKNRGEIEKLGNAATSTAAASSRSNGQFSTRTERGNVNKDTVESLAKASKEILETVVRKGHLTDSCMVILMDPRYAPSADLMRICKDVIAATLDVYRATQISGSGAAPAAAATKTSGEPAYMEYREAMQRRNFGEWGYFMKNPNDPNR